MKYFILIALSWLPLFASAESSTDYYYIYVENPDPDHYEVIPDSTFPESRHIVNDAHGSRACWEFYFYYDAWPAFTIQNKTDHSVICKIFRDPTYYPYNYATEGSCSVLTAKNSGNTFWISASKKADGTPVEAYKAWECRE